MKSLFNNCFRKQFQKPVFKNYFMMFYTIKVYLKNLKYFEHVFNIFNYVLKIIFMFIILFLIILCVCIIIFLNNS